MMLAAVWKSDDNRIYIYTGWKEILAQDPHSVIRCWKAYRKYYTYPESLSFNIHVTFRSGERGGHAVFPRCPVHLPGYVAFSFSRQSSP
jgi:hypothetical protein